jgi:hypothetical protein
MPSGRGTTHLFLHCCHCLAEPFCVNASTDVFQPINRFNVVTVDCRCVPVYTKYSCSPKSDILERFSHESANCLQCFRSPGAASVTGRLLWRGNFCDVAASVASMMTCRCRGNDVTDFGFQPTAVDVTDAWFLLTEMLPALAIALWKYAMRFSSLGQTRASPSLGHSPCDSLNLDLIVLPLRGAYLPCRALIMIEDNQSSLAL